jgi:hypothetical protein
VGAETDECRLVTVALAAELADVQFLPAFANVCRASCRSSKSNTAAPAACGAVELLA